MSSNWYSWIFCCFTGNFVPKTKTGTLLFLCVAQCVRLFVTRPHGTTVSFVSSNYTNLQLIKSAVLLLFWADILWSCFLHNHIFSGSSTPEGFNEWVTE